MNDKLRKIVIALLIIVVTGVVSKMILSQKEVLPANELSEYVPLVSTESVKLKSDTLSVPIYGYLTSKKQIEIFPEVQGKILNDNFREGTVFQKGEVIVSIDPTEFANTLKSARSQFYSLLTNVVADLSFDYPKESAVWNEFLSSIEFDQFLPELPKVEDKKLKTFLAGKGVFNSYFSITAQENRLSKYQIIAPFTGVLKQVNVKPGTVIRNAQGIGVFSSVDEFELAAPLSIKDAQYIGVGDQVRLISDEVKGEWIGAVARINSVIDQQSQNITVFLEVKSDQLFSGMYLTGSIMAKEVENVYEIHRSLLKGTQLFLVEDGQLQEVSVNVLSIDGESAVVSGLNDGQVILAKPLNNAKNGMKVRVE